MLVWILVAVGAVLLDQSLEVVHLSGDTLLTLCRVDDENDLIIGRNLCHVLHLLLDKWPSFSDESKDMPAKCEPYYYIKIERIVKKKN